MNFKKVMLIAAISSLGGLYGCSEGDESNINITSDNSGSGGGAGSPSTCPSWTTSRPVNDDGDNVCQLPNTILEDRTLTNDTVWYMADYVTVGDGNKMFMTDEGVFSDSSTVTAVVLTIEEGTQIRAAQDSQATLYITRGSQIDAEGTASNPIVFSSEDDDFSGAGEWGGLVLSGYAPHNNCDPSVPAWCNYDGEADAGIAGGELPDDSSGTLRYVVVAESGHEISNGDEINGISFLSVGSGTVVDHIQVNDTLDDGVEFYGGTVNIKNLIITGSLDDSIDWDEGYTGNLQFVIVKQVDATTGTAIEADTEGSTDFLSAPTLVNATFIGDGSKSYLHNLKASTAGFIHNSVMTGASGSMDDCVLLFGQGAIDNAAGTNVSGANPGATINTVYNNVIADCANFEISEPAGGDEADATASTNLVDGDSVIFTEDAMIDTNNYSSQAASASGLAVIDWAAFNAAHPESTADDAFLEDTDFAGAVNPDGSDLWFQGWIIEDSL